MQAIIDYFTNYSNRYFTAMSQHIGISLLSVCAALVIAFPAGILSAHNRYVGAAVTGLFSTLRILPSLAVLLLCIPIMGTGTRPAVVALTFLAIPPIFINTVLAFRTIPEAVLETALGMGMGKWRTFFLVKIPVALPLVMAGFKTSTVEVIASATLAAYIGAGGLGEIIFTGLGLMRTELLLIGGITVGAMSLAAGALLGFLEKKLLKYHFLTQTGNSKFSFRRRKTL